MSTEKEKPDKSKVHKLSLKGKPVFRFHLEEMNTYGH